MRSISLLIGGILILGSAAFVACGDDDDDDDDDDVTEEETTEEEATESESEVGEAGTPTADLVAVEGVDFAFNFDEGAISADTTGFSFTNAGEQLHELVVGRIPEDFDIDAALEDPDAPPPAEFEALGSTAAEAGEEGAPVEFGGPLGPGRYVMLCFAPDEETGEPHVSLGMTAEFTVE
ncbi:MAG: hypothetical protein GEU28_04735 [Dehalococcoidia bacterium]|nr:hypothetical protein [Dehalococcoidia bacterium]